MMLIVDIDHIHMITHLKSRAKVPCLFVPATACSLVENYINVAQELTDNEMRAPGHEYDAAFAMRPAIAGQKWRIRVGGPAGSQLITDTLTTATTSESSSSETKATPTTTVPSDNATTTTTDAAAASSTSTDNRPRAAHAKGKRDESKPIAYTHIVEVVACDHSVPTVGYGISEVRRKLKDEYSSLTGQQISKLRKDGIEVSEEILKPLFAFMGDTSPAVFTMNPHLAKTYPLIITECSFIDKEQHGDRAHKTKHTLWHDLEPIVRAHPQTMFVLIHFSHQYRADQIKDFFAKLNIPNILVWLE
jgi:ribonuclease BN (tRNA processing enzyme)